MGTNPFILFQLFSEYPMVKLIILLFIFVIIPILITIAPLAIWNNLAKIKNLTRRNVEILESMQNLQREIRMQNLNKTILKRERK